MTDLTPADLAKYIHRVPVGATIPAGMEYVWRMSNGQLVHETGRECPPPLVAVWTAEPITPPLPTEPGSVIVDVVTVAGDRYNVGILTPAGRASWVLINTEGDDYAWVEPRRIAAFAPARIVKEAGDE